MDLTLISTFLDLASSGSFSRTAERVHITQSAVSARIKTLEQALDCRLFERDHNGAKLTEAGHRFLSYAKGINRLWLQGRQDVTLAADAISQIGAGIHVCLWRRLALQWMDEIRILIPDSRVRMEVDYSEVLSEFVEEGTLDLAVIYTPQALPGLKVEKLFEDKLVMVSDRAEAMSPRVAERYVYVDWSFGYRQKHAELLPELSAPRTTIGNPEAALAYVLRNGGTAYFPQSDVEDHLVEHRLHRVQGAPVIRRPCYVTYAERPAKEELLQIALEAIRTVSKGLGSGPQEVGHYAPRSFVLR